MKQVTRVFDLIQFQLDNYPNDDCLARKQPDGSWKKYSTADLRDTANEVSRAFLASGISANDKVAIISFNRPEWNFIDYGLQQIRAVSVPMYPTITAEDYHFIFLDSDVKMVFAGNQEVYEKVIKALENYPRPIEVFTFDEVRGANNWSVFLKRTTNAAGEDLDAHKLRVQPTDLLTLIYTSGTTGKPKGVMLTHNNLVSNVSTCLPIIPVDHTSRSLSFLPLCHIYERMLHYLYMSSGISIYYAESIDTVGENMKEVKPHLFVTVPRLLEKVYDKIVAKGQELRGIKRFLFFWALELGLRYELNNQLGWWYNFQLKLANKLIFSKWREALGGNVKLIVSGGAALQPRLARVFSAAQIVVMEGYGLTETSPVISVNRYEEENRRIGTVGTIIPGVEVKIAEDGEILSRGPHIMQGYYNRPDLTAEVIDQEGWFHTGDIGKIVEGRFLKITDRKKEIFKTSGGKYIAPQQIENMLKESLVIEQAMVVGDGQKFPGALLVPAFPSLQEWCKIKEIPYTTNREMITSPAILEKFQREVDKTNEKLAQYEKIKKFCIIEGPWSVDTGEMTPTLKLKRKVLHQTYQRQIEAIYAA
jgi:long-chain acyl-CoA synthetase